MQQQWKQLKGLTIAYVGDGKGKTTAAVGVATRALGWGWKVCFMQFMKEEKWPSGERNLFRFLSEAGLHSVSSPHLRFPIPQQDWDGGPSLSVDARSAVASPSHAFDRGPLASFEQDTSSPASKEFFSPLLVGEGGGEVGSVHVEVVGEGFVGIMGDKKERDVHTEAAARGLARAREVLTSGVYQLVILDEILSAVDEGLLTEQQISDMLDAKSEDMTLVMTGHKSYPKLFEHVDLVTEMKKVKHPFDSGFVAKKGIDY